MTLITVSTSNINFMKQFYLTTILTLISLLSYGQQGDALNFDGADDYINIGTIIPSNSSYTKEAIIYVENFDGADNILSNSSSPFWISGGLLKAGNNNASQDVSTSSTNLLNSWNHVSVTYDENTSIMKLYINGSLVDENTSVANSYSNSTDILIGSYKVNHFFDGNIDEVRIWNYARSAIEINSYKDCELEGDETGLLAYYQFNQGLASGTNTTETTLLDNSSNGNDSTLLNFGLTGNSSNWVSASSIVTGTSCPELTIDANSLNLDGIDDEINCGNDTSVQITGSNITLEATIKFTSFQSDAASGNIINKQNSTSDSGYTLRAGGDGIINFAIGSGAWHELNTPTNTITTNVWYHIVATYDGGFMKIYLDGSEVASNSVPGISITNNSSNLYIGNWALTGNKHINATIDEVRIWNVTKSSTDLIESGNCELDGDETGLLAYYQFNQGMYDTDNSAITTLNDNSSNNNNGVLANFTLTGKTSNWDATSPITTGSNCSSITRGNSLNFDGSNDYIIIGDIIPSASSFTKEAMVYVENISSAGNIISSDHSPFWFVSNNLRAGNNSASPEVSYNASSLINSWNHICVTYDASITTISLFVNGTLVDQNSSSIAYTASSITIGAYKANNFYEGEIDEVRIWNYARTPTEVNYYKDCELEGNETGLLAYYKFNQGIVDFNNSSENILEDNSTNDNDGTLINFGLSGTTSNWSDTSTIITGSTCSVLAVNNIEQDKRNIKLYPNPTISNITISGITKPETFTIYNSFGIKVKNGIINNEETISIEKFSSGLYFIMLGNHTTLNFIKN